MENEPELIRQQIEEDRNALTEKLEALEQRVVGVASAVSETVEGVKEGVKETVEAVRGTVEETVETVKDAFDLRKQVERYPAAMVGGAFGVGFGLGLLLQGQFASAGRGGSRAAHQAERQSWAAPAAQGGEAPPTFSGLFRRLEQGLAWAGEMALDALTRSVQENIRQTIPAAIESQVQSLFTQFAERGRQEESSTANPPHHNGWER